MKPRELAVLAARLAVGAVLVYAGAAKASAPAEEFANVIVSYGLVGPDLALPLAAFLPLIELAVGWALVLGVGARAASAAAAAMFAMFVFALGHAVAAGIPLPNCGCFGDAAHLTPGHAMLFDTTLAVLCAFIWRFGAGAFSLDAWADAGR